MSLPKFQSDKLNINIYIKQWFVSYPPNFIWLSFQMISLFIQNAKIDYGSVTINANNMNITGV